MDTNDLQIKNKENIFKTVIKYAMSLLLIVQLINYVSTGNKKGK